MHQLILWLYHCIFISLLMFCCYSIDLCVWKKVEENGARVKSKLDRVGTEWPSVYQVRVQNGWHAITLISRRCRVMLFAGSDFLMNCKIGSVHIKVYLQVTPCNVQLCFALIAETLSQTAISPVCSAWVSHTMNFYKCVIIKA